MHKISQPKFTIIPFRNQEVLSITKEGKHYIVPKQICENLGVSWSGQFERLKRDSVLNDAIRVIRIPQKNPSGVGNIDQETICLPVEYLNGWLFGIDDSRVKAEIRDDVISYKKNVILCFMNISKKVQVLISIVLKGILNCRIFCIAKSERLELVSEVFGNE